MRTRRPADTDRVPPEVSVLLLAFLGLAIAAVPVARGRLGGIERLRFRRPWTVGLALAIQVVVISVLRGPADPVHVGLHVCSYVLGAWFLFENRRIPGVWLMAAGAASNIVAIVANGGVMPAAPSALTTAGLPLAVSTFKNSAALAQPRLLFLGDVFAVPASWPLHNVFSIGDVLLALGAAMTIHAVCGSRLIPSSAPDFSRLFGDGRFVRLWSAQAISNLGDWSYTLATAAVLAGRTRDPGSLALLIAFQVAPATVSGLVLAPLVDRYSRRRLMILTDVVRAAAVATLLVGTPSVLHIYAVAFCLGTCGAVFQPSLQATIPNIVDRDRLVAANSLIAGTYYFAVMAGPPVGGFLVARFAAESVFAINAVSFVVSALLIASVPIATRVAEDARGPVARELRDGLRYVVTTRLVRSLLLVMGIVIVAAGTKAPLESLFVLNTLSLGAQALGLLAGSWGLGMIFGAALAPTLARAWARERLFAWSVLVVGIAVAAASRATELPPVLLAWLVAGFANAVGDVSYDTLLQERTPDALRGRVFAANGVVVNAAFLLGTGASALFGGVLGVRATYGLSAVVLVAAAILARLRLPAATRGAPAPVAAGTVSRS
jgi:MFS family permease